VSIGVQPVIVGTWCLRADCKITGSTPSTYLDERPLGSERVHVPVYEHDHRQERRYERLGRTSARSFCARQSVRAFEADRGCRDLREIRQICSARRVR
jgi:hypothetical protein